MPRALVLALLLPAAADAPPAPVPAAPLTDAEAARRDALTRYGVGLMRARNDLPVQAAKQFEAAAKADPASPAPLRPLVKLYADLGRDHAAIRVAKKALELDKDDADTAHALGKLLYDGKRYAEAAAALRQAADSPRVADKPAERFGILRDLARASAAAKDWAGAESALRTADKLLTDRRDALLKAGPFEAPADLDREAAGVREKLGQALAEQKKFAEAAAAFGEAHRLAEKANDRASAARLDWNLSGVLAAEGKPADALAHLNHFLDKKPAGAAPYERLAELLRRSDRTDEIPTALTRRAALDPANEAIRWVLAVETGRTAPADADQMFRELSEKTTDPQFFRTMVRFYKDADRPGQLLDAADRLFGAARPGRKDGTPASDRPAADPVPVARAQSLANAMRSEPGLTGPLLRQAADDARRGTTRSADTWELVAGLAERDGQLAAAETALRRAVQFGSDGQEVPLRLLDVLAKQRKWHDVVSEAAGMILRAGRGNRRTLMYEVYQATAHAELGEATAALTLIQKGVVEKVEAGGRAWARRRKVMLLNILGKHTEAVKECEDILAEFPDPANVQQTRYVLSNSYLGLKKYAEAEAELRKVLDGDPDDAEALNNLGYYMADQGRNLAEAEAMVRRAVEVDRAERLRAGSPEPESGVYLDSLGWVLLRRGRPTEAREVLERAARLPDAATDATVWDHLGDVRFRLGDRPAARQAWEKAAELYTDSHIGRQGGRLDEVRRKLRQAE